MAESGNPLIERELFNRVGALLRELLTPGDDRIELTLLATNSVSGPKLLAFNENGKYEKPGGRANTVRGNWQLWDALEALRAAHYREGTGTWFSAQIVVTKDGGATAKYNYDDEPDWGEAPVDSLAYVDDQEVFPRREEKQPEWLKLKLAEGRAKLATRA